MKTYHDRTADVSARIQKAKRKRRAVAVTCLSLAVVIVAALLMVPTGDSFSTEASSQGAPFQNSPYSGLIAKLEPLVSRYDETKDQITNGMPVPGASMAPTTAGNAPTGAPSDPGDFDYSFSDKEYVEVTDNQVTGVIESDIFKRTTENIFYLRDNELSVFSIAGEDSKLVSTYTIENVNTLEGMDIADSLSYGYVEAMYLSMDGSTITVIIRSYYQIQGACTVLVSLDVSDPTNVVETNRVCVEGYYKSSRLVDDQLLLMNSYHIDTYNVDFNDPATFVPQVVTEGDAQLIAPENIIFPETLNNSTYTIICSLNAKSLSVQDTVACLSYSQDVYVSRDNIFVACGYSDRADGPGENEVIQCSMTEIAGIRYADEGLEIFGSVVLDGNIKNQYSMDEHDGILRVVTSTNAVYYEKYGGEHSTSIRFRETKTNVNLYCVDLNTWEIAASVIAFAPNGEDAQSVRFDGEKAYVCTAEVITFTDPVYFFDLSDLDNITWTDTGTIDGYSTSLIQLQDGYLLGIGYGDARQLKVEVYMEENGSVVSVCDYELFANFSEEYKSYFIDRENNLFGLAVKDYSRGYVYLLLHFDGYALNEVAVIEMNAEGVYTNTFRACMVDDYLYVMGTGYETYRRPDPLEEVIIFAVEKVW